MMIVDTIKNLLGKFTRYFGTSLIALGADVGLLMWLVYAEWTDYLTAAALGFVVGGIVKYIVSKTLVFNATRKNPEIYIVVLFICSALLGLTANHLIIYTCVELMGLPLFIAKVFSAGFVFLLNFMLLGFFVFRDKEMMDTVKK